MATARMVLTDCLCVCVCVCVRARALLQMDNHIAELTVRETLDFAAGVQGSGHGGYWDRQTEKMHIEFVWCLEAPRNDGYHY
jgi:hypothetical protein